MRFPVFSSFTSAEKHHVLLAAVPACLATAENVVHIMNPTSMATVRLLGHMDHGTKEWLGGVLTTSARKVIKEPACTHN